MALRWAETFGKPVLDPLSRHQSTRRWCPSDRYKTPLPDTTTNKALHGRNRHKALGTSTFRTEPPAAARVSVGGRYWTRTSDPRLVRAEQPIQHDSSRGLAIHGFAIRTKGYRRYSSFVALRCISARFDVSCGHPADTSGTSAREQDPADTGSHTLCIQDTLCVQDMIRICHTQPS
jgi:hypothetical protein